VKSACGCPLGSPSVGGRLDADVARGTFRLVQFTPPGSSCSIKFGTGLTASAAGCTQSVYLVVSDIEAARAELIARGVDASEVFHRGGPKGRLSGPDPARASYASFVSFTDPDGNSGLVQEVTVRLPGRVNADGTTFNSPAELAGALRRAEAAHSKHEADRRARRELGGLVRGLHRSGAGWQGAADLMAGHTELSPGRWPREADHASGVIPPAHCVSMESKIRMRGMGSITHN
jgi:hypothetical protein